MLILSSDAWHKFYDFCITNKILRSIRMRIYEEYDVYVERL